MHLIVPAILYVHVVPLGNRLKDSVTMCWSHSPSNHVHTCLGVSSFLPLSFLYLALPPPFPFRVFPYSLLSFFLHPPLPPPPSLSLSVSLSPFFIYHFSPSLLYLPLPPYHTRFPFQPDFYSSCWVQRATGNATMKSDAPSPPS